MSTETIGGYSEKKNNRIKGLQNLEVAKSLNRPVIFVKKGVTGEMLYGKKEKPNFSPLSEKATIAKSKALELFESGLSILEVANKLRKSRTTIYNYFNDFAKEKGAEWVEKVKQNKQ